LGSGWNYVTSVKKWRSHFLTDVTWNPHPPTPSPAGEEEQNPYYFLVPLSYGSGARGEGFTDFHVTPVIIKKLPQPQAGSRKCKSAIF
jgi:hypothetical protein